MTTITRYKDRGHIHRLCGQLPVWVCLVVLIPSLVSAQVVVSEIMYDAEGADAGHEWIEVFNAGSTSVPLTEWKLFEANSNHKITAVSGGDSLAPGAYAIIADNAATFLTDHTSYAGVLFDSTFSLSNTGESLSIRNADLIDSDLVSYTPELGAAGDGQSLNRVSVDANTFAPAAPSLGTGTLSALAGGTGEVTNNDPPVTEEKSTTPTTVPSLATGHVLNFPVEPQIYAYIGKDQTVIVGADVTFDGHAFNKNGEPITLVRFLWNFGDGGTKEGESVLHHWSHPGRYVVALDIAQNKYAASHSIIVTAEPAKIALSTLPDGSIVITNNAGRTLDLSGWHLRMSNKIFKIPDHSLFLSGASVAYAPDITGLTVIYPPAQLLYPSGEIAVSEGDAPLVQKIVSQGSLVSTASAASVPTQKSQSTQKKPVVMNRELADASTDIDLSAYLPEVASSARANATATNNTQFAAIAASGFGIDPWVLSAVAFIGVVVVATLALRGRSRSAWKIVEDTEEGVDI